MYLLLFQFIGCAVWLFKRGRRPPDPALTVTLIWLTALIGAMLPVIVYPVKPSLSTAILIAASHLSFVIGTLTVSAARSARVDIRSFVGRSAGIGLLKYATILFTVVALLSNAVRATVPLIGALSSLETSRLDYLETGGPSGALLQVERLLSYPSIAFVVLLPLFVRDRRKGEIVTAVLGALFLADSQLRLGGRADLIFVMASMTAVYIYLYGVRSRTVVIIVGALAAVFFVLGGWFTTQRNQNFEANPEAFLRTSCFDAEFGPLIADASTDAKALVHASCYFSSPISTMTIFIEEQPNYNFRYGAYNLGLLSRGTFTEVREDTAEFYGNRQLPPNAWATSVRDFWIDFGPLAIIVYFPLGRFLTRWHVRRAETELDLARKALLVPWVVMLPFISPFIIPTLVYPPAAAYLAALVTRQSQQTAAAPKPTPQEIQARSQ